MWLDTLWCVRFWYIFAAAAKPKRPYTARKKARKSPRKVKNFEEDFEEDIERFKSTGIRTKSHTVELCRLMMRTNDLATRSHPPSFWIWLPFRVYWSVMAFLIPAGPCQRSWPIGTTCWQRIIFIVRYFLHSEMMLQMPIDWANENQSKIWFYQMKIQEFAKFILFFFCLLQSRPNPNAGCKRFLGLLIKHNNFQALCLHFIYHPKLHV